jgi:hypothetical protein
MGGIDESNDTQRDLEQKALRNVRALVDTLEREELGRGKRKKIVVALVSIPVLALALALGVRAWNAPAEEAEKKRRACELDGWNTRAAAFMQANRLAHPELTNKEVQDDLRAAQPRLMAEAKAGCG